MDTSSPPAGRVTLGWTSVALDGAIYAQPLVVGDHVIVATEHDTVYALNALTGAVVWSRHLAAPVAGSSLPCGNIDSSGITGTPVADTKAGVVWVVTFSTPAAHTLWGLSLRTGAVDQFRDADPPGSDPRAEQQRGALTMEGSTVYVPYGGLFGDCSDYHGWVVGLSTTGASRVTYETPVARAGIWTPPGPVIASDGSLLVATGNGLPVNVAGQDQSVVRLSPTLGVEDYFTESDYASSSAKDLDLGSTSPALLPRGYLFQIGKEGIGFVLSASHLGGVGGQVASMHVCSGAIGGTAVDGDVVVVSCFDGLYAIRVSRQFGRPVMSLVWSATGFRPGPPIVAGGEVWDIERGGALAGFRVANGAQQTKVAIAVAGSFPSPSASGGWLFAPDRDRMVAYRGI